MERDTDNLKQRISSQIEANKLPLLNEIRDRIESASVKEEERRQAEQRSLIEEEGRKQEEWQTHVEPVIKHIETEYWQTKAPANLRQLLDETTKYIELVEDVEVEKSVDISFGKERDRVVELAKEGELGIDDVKSLSIELSSRKIQPGQIRNVPVYGDPGIRREKDNAIETRLLVSLRHDLSKDYLELQIGNEDKIRYSNDEEGQKDVEDTIVNALDNKGYKYIYQEPQIARL